MEDARLRVNGTLTLASRSLFFLHGDIVAGEVRMGMVVTAGPAHRPSFREPIHAVEAMDFRSERRAEVALGFRYIDAAELARWQSMAWEGVTLEVPAQPILHPCPCCGFRTMLQEERGGYEISGVCGWEDDFVQYHHPDYRGGANTESLNEARVSFFAAHPQSAPHHDG